MRDCTLIRAGLTVLGGMAFEGQLTCTVDAYLERASAEEGFIPEYDRGGNHIALELGEQETM